MSHINYGSFFTDDHDLIKVDPAFAMALEDDVTNPEDPESSVFNPTGGFDPERMSAFNIRVMDVDAFIRRNFVQQVQSTLIKIPSSNELHPEGLFSEVIFGRVGSPERMSRFGYIELNTGIIAPAVYRSVIKMGSIYNEILSGHTFATFDEESGEFTPVYGDPENVQGASTGFTFFMKCYPKIKFRSTDSLTREARVQLVDMYRDISVYHRYLVEPAGVRDISDDLTGKLIQDDINKLYTQLIALSYSIPPGSTSDLYDNVRYNIQAKAVEIYEYIDNMMTGKRGFLQGSYASRRVAMGTRNVISAALYSTARPDDPQVIGPDETMAGLFICMKGMQPDIYRGLKVALFDPIFGSYGSMVSLVNTKTFKLEYSEITEEERDRFTSADGINGIINRFKNTDTRAKPIMVKDRAGKWWYLALVYDSKDAIRIFRSVEDLERSIPGYNKDFIRPLTWIEALYLITAEAAVGRHGFVTRYPVLGDGSCYPSRIHVVSTAPGRVVDVYNLLDPTAPPRMYPQYPILGNPYQDTITPHSSRLAGLGGDFDGDTVSFNIVLADDSNEEAAAYLNSPKALVDTQKRLVSGSATDLVGLTLWNMSLVEGD